MAFLLATAKRIVVKIGSSLLIDPKREGINEAWLASLLDDVGEFLNRKQQIIMVSSGAIALGRTLLQTKQPVLRLEEKQALAAVGQIKLAHAYQSLLEKKGIVTAQVLLTLDDSENRRRYLNAKNTLETLLQLGALPIINENDTVATAEIRYGDNDRLAARVAQMISADALVLLSDIDGLYTADPNKNKTARHLVEVTKLTPEILAMAERPSSQHGSGGMVTKLSAAKIAMTSGCKMVIAAGKHLHPLQRIDQTSMKTWFIPQISPHKARKNWLAQHLKIKGRIILDKGAEKALSNGKSLLAVGIIAVEGEFHKGDAIHILNESKHLIGSGLCNYTSREVAKIMSKQSSEYKKILGYQGSDEVIHRNDLVLMGE